MREKSTLYDVLGLARTATQSDIERVYRRLTAEMQRDADASSPRRAALVHEAYEVLSDPGTRAAYDKSLRTARFSGARSASPGRKWGAVFALVAVALGALYYFTIGGAPEGRTPTASLSQQEMQAAAAVSVGRVHRVDMSGSRAALAAAVAIEEGVMMAPCAGIDPAAQIVVRIPPRDIPAQLKHADTEAGLCKLAVSGGGSWPLPTSPVIPRPGDKVYTANLNAAGEVVVTAGEVRQVSRGPRGEVIESTARTPALVEGTPLLDPLGRVVAIALDGKHTVLPKGWIGPGEPMARRPPSTPR